MSSTLKEIIWECVIRNIPVSIEKEPEAVDGVAFMVDGFAKSGRAKVFDSVNGNILVHTRYNQVDTIVTFQDLASIAFEWCDGYIANGYTYGYWAATFEELGWIKSVTKTETTWERT